jgi:hypothetical protein
MIKCDQDCPCPLKETCLGRRFPEWAEIMRGHWDSGDPIRQNFVIFRSGQPYRPDPTPELAPVTTPAPDPPRLGNMVVNLVTTLAQEVKHVATGGQSTVSEEVFRKRVSICRGEDNEHDRCQFLREQPRLRCLKCGCSGEIAFRLPVKSCPIGRWPAEN